jgi:predicted RNA binding protein YcfA (HicA-like mRNA interferase family)
VLQQRSSHVKLRKADVVVVIPVHGNKSLKRPTMMGILKDAGLSPDEVAHLL